MLKQRNPSEFARTMRRRRDSWLWVALVLVWVVGGPTMGHNGEEDERNHATAPGNPFCGEDEARRRVHLSPTSLNASLGVTSGKKVLVLDFSVEVDVHGDGVYRLLKWDEFVVHHDRRLHVILVGSDYSTFVHSHPSVANFDSNLFRAEIPLPPKQSYAGGLDFVAEIEGFMPCQNDTSENTTTSYLIETSSRFVVDVPSDPSGGGLPAWTHAEVPGPRSVGEQTVSVKPAKLWEDTTLFVDRLSQQACCATTAQCTTITQVLAPAGSVPGCTLLQYTITDHSTRKPIPALVYLKAPTHIALARRGVAGNVSSALRHIHGRYGKAGAVGDDCRPLEPMGPVGSPEARLWATVSVDEDTEYKVFVTFNTSRGVLVGVFTLIAGNGSANSSFSETVPRGVCDAAFVDANPVPDGSDSSRESHRLAVDAAAFFAVLAVVLVATALRTAASQRFGERSAHEGAYTLAPTSPTTTV